MKKVEMTENKRLKKSMKRALYIKIKERRETGDNSFNSWINKKDI